MSFLTKTDFKSAQHQEIIDAITRNDDTILDIVIGEAISFMKGYLNARYNTTVIFDATGNNRHNTILKICKDIVMFELFNIHNPIKLSETIKERYNRAVKWLEDVNAQKINPPDLPQHDDDTKKLVLIQSNTKRENHY